VPTSLRVLTYNVRMLRDDTSAVVRVLRASGADVVALQEPPVSPFGPARLRRLAQRAGYRVVVRGGGARTSALLVRDGLEATRPRAVRLAWRPGRTRRGLAVADVAGVRVISTHLGLVQAERLSHVRRVLLVVDSSPWPVVLAGDLNERPGGPTWARLLTRLHDVSESVGSTYPATGPQYRIDAVLATAGVTGSGAHVLSGDDVRTGSDHSPVVVDVSW
jgi:endonuclease/exonuclease/phosphatase family metal-dependent hydrolase